MEVHSGISASEIVNTCIRFLSSSFPELKLLFQESLSLVPESRKANIDPLLCLRNLH